MHVTLLLAAMLTTLGQLPRPSGYPVPGTHPTFQTPDESRLWRALYEDPRVGWGPYGWELGTPKRWHRGLYHYNVRPVVPSAAGRVVFVPRTTRTVKAKTVRPVPKWLAKRKAADATRREAVRRYQARRKAARVAALQQPGL